MNGTVRLSRFEQSDRIPSPIFVTLLGITILVKLLQPENA